MLQEEVHERSALTFNLLLSIFIAFISRDTSQRSKHFLVTSRSFNMGNMSGRMSMLLIPCHPTDKHSIYPSGPERANEKFRDDATCPRDQPSHWPARLLVSTRAGLFHIYSLPVAA
jgi:hypothetical protein